MLRISILLNEKARALNLGFACPGRVYTVQCTNLYTLSV